MRHKYALLTMIHSSKIENINLPSCKNCVHFIPENYNSFDSPINKCVKYGKKDIITDEIKYEYADSCRSDEQKCGKNAKDFEKEPNMNLKIIKHAFFYNTPIIVVVTTIPIYISLRLIYG